MFIHNYPIPFRRLLESSSELQRLFSEYKKSLPDNAHDIRHQWPETILGIDGPNGSFTGAHLTLSD